MPIILKNNASSPLTAPITASDTGIVVADGSQFPALSAGDYFYATLVSTAGTLEIVKVTARVGNSLSVVRAQEGSSAVSFAAGTLVELRVTAASITDLVDEHDQAAEISITDAGGYYTSGNVEGALQEAAVYNQGGAGSVTRTVQSRLRDFVSVKDFGAVGDGVTDDAAAIQAAIDAVNTAGGGSVYFPAGTYAIEASLTVYSNTRYYGVGKGSLLKWNTASAGNIFEKTSGTLEDVQFADLGFDGAINYPADSTVDKTTYTLNNYGIYINVVANNVSVTGCSFYKLSYCSVEFRGNLTKNITISNNYFEFGAYVWKVISFRANTPSTRDDYPSKIVVSNNILNTNGPQVFYDPAVEAWTASADAIQLDECVDSVVSANIIRNSSGISIRIEQCNNVTIVGNSIYNSGGGGIALYNETDYCCVVGNSVDGWGKIPLATYIRNFGGTYYYAKERPDASLAPLPADPSTSAWFEVWPYNLDGVLTGNIPAYSASDYSLFPFRGDAAIAATARSDNNVISGNVVRPNTSVDGSGDYYYASDFGFTVVHPVNSPSNNNSDNFVGSNSFNGRVYSIYHPEYTDPVNARGTLTNGTYAANKTVADNLIFENALFFDEIEIKDDAGTGTETLLKLLNQNTTFGAGLGTGVELQVGASTIVSTLTAAMKGVSFAQGAKVVLASIDKAGSTVELKAGSASAFLVKGTGQGNFVPLAAAPSGATEGDVYFNTTTKKLQCYDGTTWQDLF